MKDMFGLGEKPVWVLGLGKTGASVVQALRAAGHVVWGWDDNEAARAEAMLDWAVEAPDWREVGAVVKSPGISMENARVVAAVAAGVPVLGDLDLLYRREQARGMGAVFLGITGTNGKSTTTALVAHILAESGYPVAVGGNLGTGALALEAGESAAGLPPVYVLECSSYQLELVQELAVDAGVVLNLTPDHLERHKTMEAYAALKMKLLDLAKPDATRVVGVNQQILLDLAVARRAAVVDVETVRVGEDEEATWRVDAQGVLWTLGLKVVDLAQFGNLPGPHNWQNMAAAWALVRRWVVLEDFIRAVKSFEGLPHRLKAVRRMPVPTPAGGGEVVWVNDSKATNGDSTVPALESFAHIVWLCGGLPKSDGLGETVNHLHNVCDVVTLGQSGEAFALELEALGERVVRCETLEQAVPAAWELAKALVAEGMTPVHVLLSPAAASWDQFTSFEHRGEVFEGLVRGLS